MTNCPKGPRSESIESRTEGINRRRGDLDARHATGRRCVTACRAARAFFAPDAMHGWITGYVRDQDKPVVLTTIDAGSAWSIVGRGLADAVAIRIDDDPAPERRIESSQSLPFAAET